MIRPNFPHQLLSLLAGGTRILDEMTGGLIGRPREKKPTAKGARHMPSGKPGGRRGIYHAEGAKTYRVKGLRP